jgi:hypothetical protein
MCYGQTRERDDFANDVDVDDDDVERASVAAVAASNIIINVFIGC